MTQMAAISYFYGVIGRILFFPTLLEISDKFNEVKVLISPPWAMAQFETRKTTILGFFFGEINILEKKVLGRF